MKSAPEQLQMSLRARRILIVEDEFLIAQDLVETLTACGAHVVGPAPNVRAAVGLITGGEEIDCALLDLDLGGEFAYPIADMLTERDIPFLFSTGFDASAIDARYRDVARVDKPSDSLSAAWALHGRLELAEREDALSQWT